jgi:hypothetical protein
LGAFVSIGEGRLLQSHGLTSQVYVPILRAIFQEKYSEGCIAIDFSLDDVRRAAEKLGITARNPADVVYRMRSRTVLPAEIIALGFYILRQVGRGKYRLEKAVSTVIDLPDTKPIEALDLTPIPVRRLLPEDLADVDEQALLTVASYCKLFDHFTGLRIYRLRSHVRKSVVGIGQAELDELDVGVAFRDDEIPVVVPIEAKAVADPVNRVQISAMVAFSGDYFPDHEVRPLALKVDERGLMHILEFNATTEPSDLIVVRSACYRLVLSEKQREFIRHTRPVVL